MKLIFAILALHVWQTSVNTVHHAVADEALFDTVHLFVNVVLPKKDCRDYIPITLLN
jgi:hypothetical protein